MNSARRFSIPSTRNSQRRLCRCHRRCRRTGEQHGVTAAHVPTTEGRLNSEGRARHRIIIINTGRRRRWVNSGLGSVMSGRRNAQLNPSPIFQNELNWHRVSRNQCVEGERASSEEREEEGGGGNHVSSTAAACMDRLCYKCGSACSREQCPSCGTIFEQEPSSMTSDG